MTQFFKPSTYLFYLQRSIKSFALREKITKLFGKLLGRTDVPENRFLGFKYEYRFVRELIDYGFTELPVKLPDNVIVKIKEESENLLLTDPSRASLGEFTLQEIPQNTHVAGFKREELVKLPFILDIANDSEVLKIIQEFLGAKPTISNINMWWSFAGRTKAKDAQLFHRDVDDFKFCKLFVYLTDVGPNDGPHTYVKGSSSVNKLTKIMRYEDEKVTSVFGKENVINFIRPKGSIFLVDTYGFHKGTLPLENDRLLLQVQYSLMPIGIESYRPVVKNPGRFNDYINRLILRR